MDTRLRRRTLTPQVGASPVSAQPGARLALAQWRREVATLYAEVRRAVPGSITAWRAFCKAKDLLFREHPQSPLDERQRRAFTHLDYYPYDRAARVIGKIHPRSKGATLTLDILGEGVLRYTEIADVTFVLHGEAAQLTLYWIEGYGGGLFLPFADGSNGDTTYGGGRYLYDTIKGADLGVGREEILLDFNYAYNPSCAYNARWMCPLPPPANRLSLTIAAGEMAFSGASSSVAAGKRTQ